MDSENASLASQSGIVIGLVASAREILCRTKDDKSRPLLTGCDNWEKLQRIEKLLKERLPSLGVSQLILDTSGLNLEQSCHAIIRFLSNLGYSGKTREQAGNNMETYTFEVRTPIGNEYSIIIADGLLGNCHKLVRDLFTRAGYSPKAAVVTNPLVEHLYAGTFCDALSKAGCQPVVITIPDGEDKKTPETALIIYEQLAAAGLNRNSPLFALGGGVVGDTAGFAASTFMRGIPLIQVPTTLLAQTDSSIGGKVAVNHHTAKNLIGSFYNPVMVLIDIQTLTTLPDREYIEGLAEVVKHGIILDKDFFFYIKENWEAILKRDTEVLKKLIRRSCEIKAEIVERDFREQGLRMKLNFGHTIGHAIEAASGLGQIRHGEAISTGMVLAMSISVAKGMMDRVEMDQATRLLAQFGLPIRTNLEFHELFPFIKMDKKSSSGRLRFVLLEGLGKARVVDDLEINVVKRALNEQVW